MLPRFTLVLSSLFLVFAARIHAQDLSPRAYVITPIHTNAVILTWAFYDGSVDLNGTVPVSNATGSYNVSIFSLYHTISFFGRSANITASLPYAVGNFTGQLQGGQQSLYRSGLVDTSFRFSVNLKGGPAMTPKVFSKWQQKTLIGMSLKVVAPTGQYDPTKLVNWGINRWAFKPELGISKRWNHLVLDGYGGAWLYTNNPTSFDPPTPRLQSEAPIGSFEGHLSYDLRPRYWVSVDGNFWFGGTTTLNGIENQQTRQTSSRIGATGSIPLGRHQSIKVNYSNGTYIRFGGNYQNVAVAWQYQWSGRPQ
jgi:hypothetical protein